MARNFDYLPVYKATYDLLVMVNQMGGDLSREYRYSVLEDLRRCVIAVAVLIYETHDAATPDAKLSYLEKALKRMVVVCLHLRILRDCAHLSLKRYAQASEQAVAVEKHLTDWRDYNRRMISPPSKAIQTSLPLT